jgi:hypothetical protein
MYIAEKNFKPRLTKPEAGNPYYNQKPKGYSGCILGNPLDKGCNVLANCQGYATGRYNECTEEGRIVFFGKMNACSMYAYGKKHGLPTSDVPVVGAIACWSGGKDKLGHVVSVEKVYSKTKFLGSESQYKYFIFRTKTREKGKDGNWGMSSDYEFQGFVKNPHIIKLAEPVERNEEVNQLKVIKNKLRIRVEPGLEADILDFAELGIYNDLETKEADGYVWHKIAEMNWLAEVEGYVELLPKVEFRVDDIVILKEPITKYKITNIENDEVSIIPITNLDNLIKEERLD